MIIDSHVHFGKSIWGDFTPDYLMNVIDEYVDVAVCSNLEGIDSPVFKSKLHSFLSISNFKFFINSVFLGLEPREINLPLSNSLWQYMPV